MKTIDVLKWIDYDAISGEVINIFELDEETDYNAMFGYDPETRPEMGTYLVIYSDTINEGYLPRKEYFVSTNGLYRKEWHPVKSDYIIVTDNADSVNGGMQVIYFWKLEN